MKQFDQENVWKIVKETRKSFLSQHKNPECLDDGTLLSDNSIKDNIDTVEKKLKLSPIYSPNKKVSGNTLEDAVNVYTYLNYCPPLLHQETYQHNILIRGLMLKKWMVTFMST